MTVFTCSASEVSPPQGVFPDSSHELLLHAALSESAIAYDAWNLWCREHDAAQADCDVKRLLPLVGYNLRDHKEGVPQVDIVKHFSRFWWARSRFLFAAMGQAVQALQQQGIDALLIKGTPLAVQHYPSPCLRPMNDGDILVRPEDFDRAVEVLSASGWSAAREEMPTAGHHAAPFRNAAQQEIDLHRFALGECPFAPEDEYFWSNSTPICIANIETRATDATDTLFMTCVHSVHSRLRWVADAVILARSPEVDWPRLVEQAQNRGLALVTYQALHYVATQFAAPVPEHALQTLASTPIPWIEKQEYLSWSEAPSQRERILLRYASYRRLAQASKVGMIDYLQLLGDLKSRGEVPSWLLDRGLKALHLRKTEARAA